MKIFFNGKIVDEKDVRVSIRDHGFLYGDGVYETLRVYGGKPFEGRAHLLRLKRSADGIRIRLPLTLKAFRRALGRVLRANGHQESVVRITVTRGPGPYGFDIRPCRRPTVVLTSSPCAAVSRRSRRERIRAAIVPIRRNPPASLPPDVKSTSCLNGILAKMASLDVRADEGIMLSHRGTLTEGSVCNVFIVKKGRLLTPERDRGLLPGVTREFVCRLARKAGVDVHERLLRLNDLLGADEAFLTSTIMEIRPIRELVVMERGNRVYRLPALTKRSVTRTLQVLFRKEVNKFYGRKA